MKKLLLLSSLLVGLQSVAQTYTQEQYQQDFNLFWQTFNDNYCYFEKKQVNWDTIQSFYRSATDTVSTRSGFISLLEKALFELYDHHCSLHTNNRGSRRLVPTGADIWAEYHGDKPLVVEVRRGFPAEKIGIRAGMEVISVNDLPIEKAILPYLGHTVNNESKSFALRLALAGDHVTKRKLTLKTGQGIKDFYPDEKGMALENITYASMVESKLLNDIGYIKINNYLFDNDLIAKFDSVLNTLLSTNALIIDLRETPSGGNTFVARAILGRFITQDHFYQKHELWAEEKQTGIKRSWEEIVSPRGIPYLKPLVILVDHWTGSVSEGIAIGFDGMKRATVIGTQMARLNGAVEDFQLPNTKIGVNITTERLYHVNGMPRELFNPAVIVDLKNQSAGNDLVLQSALQFLRKKTN
jgi:C-terminal processing protease CtpA/Prc